MPTRFGTDLWGPEARSPSPASSSCAATSTRPSNILRSATVVNAELLMQKGMLGAITPGAYADLLVVDGDPLADSAF